MLKSDPDTIVELPKQDGPLAKVQRDYNRFAMVQWINADLLSRAHHDVDKSIVLYDADGDFLLAITLPDGQAELTIEQRQTIRLNTPVRFYSKGLK